MANPRKAKTTSTQKSTTGSKPEEKDQEVKTLVKEKKNSDLPDFKEKQAWLFETIGNKPTSYVLENNLNIKATNPKTGRYESIRYARGTDSIFVSGQPEKVEKEQIVFDSGELLVDSTNDMLLEFLFKHPSFNVKYRLVDKAKDAKQDLQMSQIKHQAESKVFNSDFSDLRVIANVLGYETETEEVCRRELLNYAATNPQALLDMFDSDVVQIKSKLKTAFRRGILVSDSNIIKWNHGGKIADFPTGLDPIEYLAHKLSEGGTSNENVLKEIDNKLQ